MEVLADEDRQHYQRNVFLNLILILKDFFRLGLYLQVFRANVISLHEVPNSNQASSFPSHSYTQDRAFWEREVIVE